MGADVAIYASGFQPARIMHPFDAYRIWRDRFAEALDPEYYNIEYLDRLIAGDAQIRWNADAAIIFELKTFPGGKKVVHGIIAAGELDAIKALILLAEQWGRNRGCTAALIESRSGWERIMRDEGYKPFQISIAKDL